MLTANSRVFSGIVIAGCESVKAPIEWSSVKPCTPAPSVSTIIATGPYIA